MSHRIFNFSAGPAMLPTEVLEKSAAALLDYEGKGFGIAEVSHRGKEFEAVNDEAITRGKKLLNLGDTHDVVFLQGGATALFTLIPMNFLHTSADYLVSGEWSKKAVTGGKEIGKLNVVATSEASNFDHSPLPNEWKLASDADYFHVCYQRNRAWPSLADLAQASEPDRRRQQRVHVSAAPGRRLRPGVRRRQKNLGPAGVVLVIVRKDMYAKQNKTPSKLWSFKDQAENKSMINTPPTFGIYILLEIFRWLERRVG